LNVDSGEADADLIVKTLRGDDGAFTRLIGRHKHWIHRFVRRYVGAASEDAYDVVQETFFAAWLGLSRYRPELPFEAWLRRIALNKCRDRARRNTVRRFLVGAAVNEQTGEPLDVMDQAAGPEVQVGSMQELAELELAVAALPRGLKEPLLLTTLEGLSHQEAGALLGINAKAVEMRVYRARERLKAVAGKTDKH
jgi:RNA polymerase sigma factor (sigma-70 family)